MDLTKKRCVPCEGGTPPLLWEQVKILKKSVSTEWIILENTRIRKEYLFDNYKQTLDFVNRVANLAEEEGHHPVMHVYYSKVEIELWTHAVNGLTENDFIMASKIDKIN